MPHQSTPRRPTGTDECRRSAGDPVQTSVNTIGTFLSVCSTSLLWHVIVVYCLLLYKRVCLNTHRFLYMTLRCNTYVSPSCSSGGGGGGGGGRLARAQHCRALFRPDPAGERDGDGRTHCPPSLSRLPAGKTVGERPGQRRGGGGRARASPPKRRTTSPVYLDHERRERMFWEGLKQDKVIHIQIANYHY